LATMELLIDWEGEIMIGDRLKLLRKAGNLTQTQLAEKLNVSKQAISNWENNNISPAAEQVKHIALFFGCSTDYLLEMDLHYQSYLEIDGISPEKTAHLIDIVHDIGGVTRYFENGEVRTLYPNSPDETSVDFNGAIPSEGEKESSFYAAHSSDQDPSDVLAADSDAKGSGIPGHDLLSEGESRD
jgi:transcriptional regulator with XRE-family HTH domain